MDPELKMRLEWAEARDAFIAAKKTRDKNPDGYDLAKAKMSKMRTHWREIREALATPAEGTATTTTIAATAKTN